MINRRHLMIRSGQIAAIVIVLAAALWFAVAPTFAVHNGTDVEAGQLPWFVELTGGCGGTLITPEWVMSAAHCVAGSTIGKSLWVEGTGSERIEATVIRVIRYDAESTLYGRSDIALLQLDQPILGVPTMPLALPGDHLLARQGVLAVAGRGVSESHFVLKPTEELPEPTDLSADSYRDWYEFEHSGRGTLRYNDQLEFSPAEISADDRVLLVGVKDAHYVPIDTPGATCYSDSGGGLVFNKTMPNGSIRPTLIGVVSAVDYCKEIAVRRLFEEDGDNDPLTHTLPNSLTVDIPISYLVAIADDRFGYSRYANVGHEAINNYIYCNIPALNPTVTYQTIITGRIVLDTDLSAQRQNSQLAKTSIALHDAVSNDELCMTVPDPQGWYTLSLPTEIDTELVALTVKSTEYRASTDHLGNNVNVYNSGASLERYMRPFRLTPGSGHELYDITILATEDHLRNRVVDVAPTFRGAPLLINPETRDRPFQYMMPIVTMGG